MSLTSHYNDVLIFLRVVSDNGSVFVLVGIPLLVVLELTYNIFCGILKILSIRPLYFKRNPKYIVKIYIFVNTILAIFLLVL